MSLDQGPPLQCIMLLTSEEKSNIITNVMLPGTHTSASSKLDCKGWSQQENVTEEALIHAESLCIRKG